jgi:hypothetical protein
MRQSDRPDPSRRPATRGRPFANGNPGRKPGSKNHSTVLAAALLEDEREVLLRKAIEIARNGDVVMLKFLLSRILPRERGIRIDLPKMDFADDAVVHLLVAGIFLLVFSRQRKLEEANCRQGQRLSLSRLLAFYCGLGEWSSSRLRSAIGIWLLFHFGRQFNHSPDCFGSRGDVHLSAAPVVHSSQKCFRDSHLKWAILQAFRWATGGAIIAGH